MTLRRPHNMLALLLVLMISLIIKPVFAMPGHQSMPAQFGSISHCSPAESTCSHANQTHQQDLHCSACDDSAMMDGNHCGDIGDKHKCKSCKTSHGQYSTLPVVYLVQSNLSAQNLPLQITVTTPVSRPENSLRPPIH